jgi:aminopeptidase N
MLRVGLFTLIVVLLIPVPAAPDTYPRQPGVDALHYAFDLTLTDESDVIEGKALIELRFVQDGVHEVRLDLVGMEVRGVRWSDATAKYRREGGSLHVTLPRPSKGGEILRLSVEYRGTPSTGLRIGTNQHGERTFFSDNWPNRARHWLPTIDHPYDKATSEMIVTAPAHYQVVSNGLLVEESDLDSGRRRTRWKQSVPIATWLYVLGVARFAVDHYGVLEGRELQSWVYPQDRDAGFRAFSGPTRHVLEYFGDAIGPFAYEKLANVQSASVSGAMESATAIFYGQDLLDGKREERLRHIIVHEIAHQWWGNAVTEADWDDVWLSEGFATYFTLLFREHAYGREDFRRGLEESRKIVLEFEAKTPDYRIVHDNLDDMSQVTSSHTYEKGAWVLHMLRGRIGDDAFWQGIRSYYSRFRDRNATTTDFRGEMEEASGTNLERFFEQWLYRGGLPAIEGEWRHENGSVVLELRQTQPAEPFELSIPVGIEIDPGAPSRIETLRLNGREVSLVIPVEKAPRDVTLDPDLWVLMESATLVLRSTRE